MRTTFVFMLICLFCFGCTQQEVKKSALNIDGGFYIYKGKKYTGRVLNGNRSFNCVNGKQEGEFIVLDKNGKELIHEYYSKGLLEGESLKYHHNGQLEHRINYVHGEYHGKFEKYNEFGVKVFEGHFKNGVENGSFRVNEYYNNLKCSFVNGKLNGQLSLYDIDGELCLNSFYMNGKVVRKKDYFMNNHGFDYIIGNLNFKWPLNRKNNGYYDAKD